MRIQAILRILFYQYLCGDLGLSEFGKDTEGNLTHQEFLPLLDWCPNHRRTLLFLSLVEEVVFIHSALSLPIKAICNGESEGPIHWSL